MEDLLNFRGKGHAASTAEIHRKALIVDHPCQLRSFNRCAKVPPEFRLNGGEDHELAIFGLIKVVFRTVGVSDIGDGGARCRYDAVAVPAQHVITRPKRNGRVGTRRVDKGALSGLVATMERGHGSQRRIQRTYDRRAECALKDRRGIGFLSHEAIVAFFELQRTTLRHHHITMHGNFGVGTAGSETTALAVNDVWLHLALLLEADPEPRAGRTCKSIDEDVRRLEQLEEDFAALCGT